MPEKVVTTWRKVTIFVVINAFAAYKTLSKTFLFHSYIPGIWVWSEWLFWASLSLEPLESFLKEETYIFTDSTVHPLI